MHRSNGPRRNAIHTTAAPGGARKPYWTISSSRLPPTGLGFPQKRASLSPRVIGWLRLGLIPEPSRKPADHFQPPSPTFGPCAATGSRASTCTPTPQRCSRRRRAEKVCFDREARSLDRPSGDQRPPAKLALERLQLACLHG